MTSLQKINKHNHNAYSNDGINALPVRTGFWNALIAFLSTMITEAGDFLVDIISEKTSGSGVTIDGVLLKDSQVTTGVINEVASAGGITVDGLVIRDRKAGDMVSIVATSGGTGTAMMIESQHHVIITSTNVNHIVTLPKLANVPTGVPISGSFVNTGCELRPHPHDQITDVTVNNVSATGGAEIALDNSTGGAYFEAVKTAETAWIVKVWSSTGAYRATVPN